jgi:flagellar capping protein FliD
VIKEANLRRQWTAVQTALTSLQNQQSWLTQQTATKSG